MKICAQFNKQYLFFLLLWTFEVTHILFPYVANILADFSTRNENSNFPLQSAEKFTG